MHNDKAPSRCSAGMWESFPLCTGFTPVVINTQRPLRVTGEIFTPSPRLLCHDHICVYCCKGLGQVTNTVGGQYVVPQG